MRTICTNEECSQKYKIGSGMLGLMARCKKCDNVFKVQEYKEAPKPNELAFEEDAPEEETETKDKKRRTAKEAMEDHIAVIEQGVNDFLPRLNLALDNQENESGTRLLIDKMLQSILGYKIEDIKTEQRIEGRRADYVLTIKGEDAIVMEAKKIGMALRDRQIFQATSYGAYSGIRWAILTNALIWQLYHISIGDKVESDLVFTVDLRDGLDDEEANYFYLISKFGMRRKKLLENHWRRISALCEDNVMNAILADDVVAKIRSVLSKQTGYKKLTNEEVRAKIEENIFQLT
jgi:predicted type IV restriction endonuclease